MGTLAEGNIELSEDEAGEAEFELSILVEGESVFLQAKD